MDELTWERFGPTPRRLQSPPAHVDAVIARRAVLLGVSVEKVVADQEQSTRLRVFRWKRDRKLAAAIRRMAA